MIHWTVAVNAARKADDVTYEEWCYLYVDGKESTPAQITVASATAKEILVRNGLIDPDVVIILT